ncbi:hypothetical protein ACW5R3_12135 [Bizionia sp. KMM 8389]
MKKLQFLFVLFFTVLFSYSQTEGAGSVDEEKKFIKSKNFKVVYNRLITSVLNGDNNLSSIGSYISLDITKPNVSMAVSKNWFKKNGHLGSVTTAGFNGGITNGTSEIFKNEKYNSNIKFKLEHSFVLIGSFKYIDEYLNELNAKKTKLDDEKLLINQYIEVLKAKEAILKEELVDDDNTLTELDKIALREQLIATRVRLSKLNDKEVQEKLDNIEQEVKWSSIKLLWLSGVGEYGTQSARLYNLENDYDKQINKISPESYKLGVSLNYYYDQVNDLPIGTDFQKAYLLNGLYSFSYSYSSTNNINELTSSEFITESNTNISGDEMRYKSQSVKAYSEGDYDEFKQHSFEFNINKKIIDNLYLTLSYDINFISDSDKYNGNYQNLKLGTVFGIVNKKDLVKKTVVNIEPFVLFNDLGDKFEDSGDEFYKRSLVGIRTTIPFSNVFSSK